MAIFEGLTDVRDSLHGCVLTIGNFDGVHRGHQHIIAQAGLLAVESGAKVVVLTFEPHPLEIVAPKRAPARLMPAEQKAAFLQSGGADHVVVIESTPALLGLEPQEFVEQVIIRCFEPVAIVEGSSFGFGKGRRGDVALLRRLGKQFGFEVCEVEPLTLQMGPADPCAISSSLVRKLVREGRVHRARLCLGRPYTLWGVVESGHGRGRELGFPTANLGRLAQLIPAEGVYAGGAEVCGSRYPAAISIGTNPTFAGRQQQVEAHLLGNSQDLYDQPIELALWSHLRAQKKFESPEALRCQIALDVEAVRQQAGAEPDWQKP